MSKSTYNSIQSIQDLHYYLKVAIQLEHATIPPYLVALYSIKPGSNQQAANIIRTVVVEEMLHLTLAVNLLNAVGGKADLSYAGFVPQFPTHLPDGETDFEVSCARFSLETIETFLNIERPAKENRGSSPQVSSSRKTTLINPKATENDDQIPKLNFYSIGEFYDEIIRGFQFLYEQSPDELFSGNPAHQITNEYYYSSGGKVISVYNLDSAIMAMNEIIEQGEGARNTIKNREDEVAHYYRFEQLKLGRYYVPGDQPGLPSGDILKVDWSAVYPIKKNAMPNDYPEGSQLRASDDEFNAFYEKFLADLTEAFNGKPEMLVPAVANMFHIKSLIHSLVRNPIPGNNKFNGAPTFYINRPKTNDLQSKNELSLSAKSNEDSDDYHTFIDLSIVLTGFTEYQLYGTGQSKAYFATLIDILGKTMIGELCIVYRDVMDSLGKNKQEFDQKMRFRLFGDPKYGPLTRNILKLWYSGSWYQLPQDWRNVYGERINDITFVISSASYTEGLLWPTVGANPSGAKPFGYGTWADPPQIETIN